MVAYSFQKRFAGLVETRTKNQTIRAHRKRHARPDEPIQLYTCMRTKQCRKLVDPDPICHAVLPISINVATAAILVDGERIASSGLDDFARADGFKDLEDMLTWWQRTHDEWFDGVLVDWPAP